MISHSYMYSIINFSLKGTRKGDFCDSKACFVVFARVPQVPECRRAVSVTGIMPFVGDKWERLFSLVMNWIRTRLSFAILRATLLCVHGSRTKWRCLGITDGASLPLPID